MTETYFEIDGLSKTSTEDDFEMGEVGRSSSFYVDLKFSKKELEEVIEEAREWLGVDPGSVDREAGNGIINFSRLENAAGYEPSNDEVERWKAGNLKLYHVIYTGEVKKVTSEIVDLN
jgi:hypothetical protein